LVIGRKAASVSFARADADGVGATALAASEGTADRIGSGAAGLLGLASGARQALAHQITGISHASWRGVNTPAMMQHEAEDVQQQSTRVQKLQPVVSERPNTVTTPFHWLRQVMRPTWAILHRPQKLE